MINFVKMRLTLSSALLTSYTSNALNVLVDRKEESIETGYETRQRNTGVLQIVL